MHLKLCIIIHIYQKFVVFFLPGACCTIPIEVNPMADFSKPLGDIVKQARKSLGMTQVQVAEKIGVDQRTIIKIENYQGNPKMNVLFPLLRLLEIDPWSVFYPEEKLRSSSVLKITTLLSHCSDEEVDTILPIVKSVIEALHSNNDTFISQT